MIQIKYVKITLLGGSSYIETISNISNALNEELDGIEFWESIVLKLTPIDISDEEYESLPEFMGH